MSAILGAFVLTSLMDLGMTWIGMALFPNPVRVTVFSSLSSQEPPRSVGLWRRTSWSNATSASSATLGLRERSEKIFLALDWGPPAYLIFFSTNIWTTACKHPTEKLMRSGVWGVEPPKDWDWVIKSEITPSFSGEFPFQNPNSVDWQKLSCSLSSDHRSLKSLKLSDNVK